MAAAPLPIRRAPAPVPPEAAPGPSALTSSPFSHSAKMCWSSGVVEDGKGVRLADGGVEHPRGTPPSPSPWGLPPSARRRCRYPASRRPCSSPRLSGRSLRGLHEHRPIVVRRQINNLGRPETGEFDHSRHVGRRHAPACCTDVGDGVGGDLFRCSGSRLHAAQIQCRPSPPYCAAEATRDELGSV